MERDTGDYDPRIVSLYDEDNPDGPDHDYFRSLARRTHAKSVLDVGCGTGILTVTFCEPGRTVVGVDPSSSMTEYARQRPGAELVNWICGDSRAVSGGPFDLVVMTGNVAQHIPNPHWQSTLTDLRRVMAKDAVLAFESRNPACGAWESWSQPEPTTRSTDFGPLREWADLEVRGGGEVMLRSYNEFVDSGDTVIHEQLLVFRDAELLSGQVEEAGFEVVAIWGDWNQTPFDGSQQIMVFEARAI